MIKYLILTIFIGFFLYMGLSCNNCNPATQLLLTEQQKKQNPFNGFEKIKYKTGDSIIEFIGTGRKNQIIEHEFNASYCQRDFTEYDYLNFTNNLYEIRFKMEGQNSFSLFFNDSINEVFLETWFYVESDHDKNSGYTEHIDTLYIGENQFLDIYKDTLYQNYSTPDFPDSINHATFLYYSTEYGIVKFDFSDGSTWELEDIIW